MRACNATHARGTLSLSLASELTPRFTMVVHTVRNGHIKRITDADIQSSVLEIAGTNVSTTYITCPADPKKTLGIKLPFLVMIIKNVGCHELVLWDGERESARALPASLCVAVRVHGRRCVVAAAGAPV